MNNSGYPKNFCGQRGVTLLVGLIMVLLMTLVGMAAIRGSNMQELMAANMRDHNLALQAAEAALRAGEARLDANVLPAFTGTGENAELMQALEEGGNSDYWAGYEWAEAKTPTLNLKGVARQPQYIIEEVTTISSTSGVNGNAIDSASQMGQENMVVYRVSSRGFGGSEDTEIILQSTYTR
ncbi:PilX N-terminal domain-containing pilus assembly protein [Microbulbifer bruguierae]|uniref:PilX N-terminal domain-containing pilus assembly protein n=1 Tax=Microbulbifer bruguierae TaxID=3029061 RepID=A0ABY8NJB0_9GAMM|nr:PilX N-terminal domain-containing pilus assembly protein [Microbulbifer bruguierae]WGL18187.1 PilX N-terminal domain-containing pilus assembly protein [Microbulbifer bruguierae]